MTNATDPFQEEFNRLVRQIENHPLYQYKTRVTNAFGGYTAYFHKDDIEGSIYLGERGFWKKEDYYTDSFGNEYVRAEVKIEVSYTSYGAESPTRALKRLAFNLEIATLAAELETQVMGKSLYKLIRTAEEVAEDRVKAENKAHQELVVKTVKDHSKGMRVHGVKKLGVPPVFQFGTHDVTLGIKHFSLVVTVDEVSLQRNEVVLHRRNDRE